MTLNLITDSWIPAFREGETVAIRPDQIAEAGVSALAWQRPDFNLACLELLVGLVSMADPPSDGAEWLSRLYQPDAGRLRDALAPFAPSFSLDGDGPRFLQDLEPLERAAKTSDFRPVDMLFIDSAGDAAVRKNADLMVKRNRFSRLAPGVAAMALYTLQAFAPAGGAGIRTSMRGGGPLVTLVHPLAQESGQFALWRLIVANVRTGLPLTAREAGNALPWLRPTRTSEKGQTLIPSDSHPLEAYFGMPRRLRLVFRDGHVTGVVQRPYGTNYAAWKHPLTPYYRKTAQDPEWLPVHPRPGRLSYRNWVGVTLQSSGDNVGTRRAAKIVQDLGNRPPSRTVECEIMAGGWSMDNMKPVDFFLDRYPAFPGMDDDGEDRVRRLVEAANTASGALRTALQKACQMGGTSAGAVLEEFFAVTEAEFTASVGAIVRDKNGDTEIEEKWYGTLRERAERMFEDRMTTGLADLDVSAIEKRVVARRKFLGVLRKKVRETLELPVPKARERKA